MATTSWVAAHTGLPSFYSATSVRITQGDRVLSDGTAGPVMVSDALATPGAPTAYLVGGVETVLTRTAPGARFAVVTRLDGRGVQGLWYRDLGDPEKASTGVTRFANGVARWDMAPVVRSGSGRFISWEPSMIEDVWALLLSKEPLVVSAGAMVPGASPLRVVTIDAVSRERVTPEGATSWDVTWTTMPGALTPGAAPVVTWGDWENTGHGWEHVTVLDLMRSLAGMPA